jgi:chloride channel 3/4/5
MQLFHPKTPFTLKLKDILIDGIVLVTTGAVLGTLAGCIDVVEGFLHDFKSGICFTDLYLSRQKCCPAGDEICNEWFAWNSVFLGGYLLYIAIAVFYAFLAALIVDSIAKSAAGRKIVMLIYSRIYEID